MADLHHSSSAKHHATVNEAPIALLGALGPHTAAVAVEVARHEHRHADVKLPNNRSSRANSSTTEQTGAGTIADSVTISIQPSTLAIAAELSDKKSAAGVQFDLAAVLKARRPDADLKKIRNADVREYYQNQNELIDFYAEAERARAEAAQHAEDALKRVAKSRLEASDRPEGLTISSASASEPEAASEPRSPTASEAKAAKALRVGKLVDLAINLSFAANVALLAIKVYAATASGSLAVIASTVDSVMDLVSGFVVWLSSYLAQKRNPYMFPVGKSRYEPISIIVFAALMGAASLQLISQGVDQLTKGFASADAGRAETDYRTYIVLATIIGVKGTLFVFCSAIKKYSTSVAALALDHFADVITNGAPLIAVLLAHYYSDYWWLDPVAAILMSVYMVWMWADAAKAQIMLITGQAATPREISEITFLALTHSPAIKYVDTVLAYQLGNKLQVELDIVLPRNMPLDESHDIGESLQKKVEWTLDNVERCFVHADYEWMDHKKDDEHYNPYDQPAYAPPED